MRSEILKAKPRMFNPKIEILPPTQSKLQSFAAEVISKDIPLTPAQPGVVRDRRAAK
jgi:hypothetical protein